MRSLERVFASSDPLDVGFDRILACSDRYLAPVEERVLPDGAVHLIFNLRDKPSGDRGADLDALVMGPTCAPTRLVFTGHVEQVCVSLRMGAAAAVLGVPAGELTDRGVALDELWGRAAIELHERVLAAPAHARVAVVERSLRERTTRAEPPSPATFEAIRLIVASGGRIRVRELAFELGVSERRVQQLFHEHIGLSPKEICRLARFRDVLARSRRERARGWTELALEFGFYDQAHLANEVRAFTGLTPGELARRGDFGFFQDDRPAVG